VTNFADFRPIYRFIVLPILRQIRTTQKICQKLVIRHASV